MLARAPVDMPCIRKKCFDGVDFNHFCSACSTSVSRGCYVASGSDRSPT